MTGEEARWKRIFVKYAGVVADAEGVYFLYDWDWSKRDWAAICEVLKLGRTEG